MRIVDLEQRVQPSGRLSFAVRDDRARHFYGSDRDGDRVWTYRLALDGAWTHSPVEHATMLDTDAAITRVSEHEIIVVSHGIAYRVAGTVVTATPLAIDDVRTALLRERADLTDLRVESVTFDGDTAVVAVESSYREPVSTGPLGLPYHGKTTLHRFSTRDGTLASPAPPADARARETGGERARRVLGIEKGLWTEVDRLWCFEDAIATAHATRGKNAATLSYIVGDRAVLTRKRLERKSTRDNLCQVELLPDGFLYSTTDGLIGRFRDGAFEHLETSIYAAGFHACGDELYVFSPGNRVYRLEL